MSDQQPTPEPGTPEQGTHKPVANGEVVLGVFVLAVIVAFVAWVVVSAFSSESDDLEDIVSDCTNSIHIRVTDGGQAISMTTQGDLEAGAPMDDVSCVTGRLGMPDEVAERVNATSMVDGPQTASWEGHSASWTFNPGFGMDLVVTRRG